MQRVPLLLLVGSIVALAAPAQAAERSVMAELMTATWCTYCPWAESALHQLEDEYDRDRFVVIGYHVTDEYSNVEGDARIGYYQITGTPTTAFDGTSLIVGGWDGVYTSYKNRIDSDMTQEAQLEMSITGTATGSQVDYAVHVSVGAPPIFTEPKLYVALGERGLIDDNEEMRPVVRRIVSHELGGLVAAGDEVVATGSFPIEEEWDGSAMEIVAFVQDLGDRKVDQSTRMFFTAFDSPTDLVTATEDSMRVISTHLSNPNSYPIDMRMQMGDLSEDDWMATFCILEWGICLPDSLDLTLPADSTVTVKLQWIDMGATEKTLTSNFMMRYGENYDIVKSVPYTARSGQVTLEVAELLIDDDNEGGSSGNGDGVPQPGEAIEFITRAHNTGGLLAYGVNSELTTSDAGVFVFEPEESYGDIDAGATADGSGGRFVLDEDVVPETVLTFVQTFTDAEQNVLSDTIYVEVGAVGVAGDGPGLPGPSRTALHQNQPNPFNPRTNIGFDLQQSSDRVDLSVYDLSGREVRRLIDGPRPAGRHSVVWDGTDSQHRPLPSGVYLYRLTTGDQSLTRRMLLIK